MREKAEELKLLKDDFFRWLGARSLHQDAPNVKGVVGFCLQTYSCIKLLSSICDRISKFTGLISLGKYSDPDDTVLRIV